MKNRAAQAGGTSPLPAPPAIMHLEDLANRVGNDQLMAIFDQLDALKQQAAQWQKQAELIARREPRWRELKSLLEHAVGLPVADEVHAEVAAIEQHRSLLADPDPVPSLAEKLTQALREALNQVHARCAQQHTEGQNNLATSPIWTQLNPTQQCGIIGDHQLDGLPKIAVGSTEDVLKTLQAMKLAEWKNLCDALPTRFAQTLQAAAKLLEPKAQPLKTPGATIRSEDDLAAWLTTTAEQVREKLKQGPVIITSSL
jgi:hypothetical protein